MMNATAEKPASFVAEAVTTLVDWGHQEDNKTVILAVTSISVVVFYLLDAIRARLFEFKAPVVGYRSWLEPGWLVGLRFARASAPMLREGYQKFKDGMFKIRRNDAEVLIIPRKHVDELRDMPETKLSAMDAHIKNMVAHYTIGNVSLVRDSDLHRRTLQKKLTPALGTLIPSLKDELNYAMQVEIPSCDKDWAGVHINNVTIGIVARISARVFVGPDLCRDKDWLHASIHFTKSLGMTRNLLRLFPAALRPVAARLLPSYWRIYSNLSAAQRMICPIIRERRAAETRDPDYEKPNDFLQWMMDEARPGEDHPNDIAHRQLLVSLASIHTTSMQVSHFIYDICSHPEYFEPLREEIASVLREDGGFKKPTLNKLRKMDSFLKESQRLNPPLTMSFQRVVRKTLTLKDGTTFPAGTHFAMASDAISHDPTCLPGGGDPEVFDPFRYARLREDKSRPENANRYQFATTDSASLHFGHGIFACPGRFFASNEIKLILCHLLMQYDFKFPNGQSRPKNLCYEEASYPDPTATVLIHKRPVSDPVVARVLLG